MKIKFEQDLKNYDDAKLTDPNGVIMTLKKVICDALSQVDSEKCRMSKFERSELAIRIYQSKGQFEITVEEMADVKAVVDKAWPPIVINQVYKILEGKEAFRAIEASQLDEP